MDVIHRGKPSSGLMVDRSRTLSLSQAFRVQPFFFLCLAFSACWALFELSSGTFMFTEHRSILSMSWQKNPSLIPGVCSSMTVWNYLSAKKKCFLIFLTHYQKMEDSVYC